MLRLMDPDVKGGSITYAVSGTGIIGCAKGASVSAQLREIVQISDMLWRYCGRVLGMILGFWPLQIGAGFNVGFEAFGDEVAPDTIKSLGGWLVDLAVDVYGDPELRACGIGQKFVGGNTIDSHA